MKPAPWAVTPGLIVPKWRSLRPALQFPFWDSAGGTAFGATAIPTITAGQIKVHEEWGGYYFVQDSSSYIQFEPVGPIAQIGQVDVTCVFGLRKTSAGTTGLFQVRGAASNMAFNLDATPTVGGLYSLRFDRFSPSGGVVDVPSSDLFPINEWFRFVFRLDDVNDEIAVFSSFDGAVKHTAAYTETYTGGVPTAITLGGADAGTPSGGIGGDIFDFDVYWGALSDEMCRQLVFDPFGPITMNDEVGSVIVPAAAAAALAATPQLTLLGAGT